MLVASSYVLLMGQDNFQHRHRLGNEWTEGSAEVEDLGVLGVKRWT